MRERAPVNRFVAVARYEPAGFREAETEALGDFGVRQAVRQ